MWRVRERGRIGRETLRYLSSASEHKRNDISSRSKQLCLSQEQRSLSRSGLINVDKAFENWSGEWAACSKVIKLARSSWAVLFEDGLWWGLQHWAQDSSGDPFSHSTPDRFIFLSLSFSLCTPMICQDKYRVCCWGLNLLQDKSFSSFLRPLFAG